ncbi:molybdopterin-dependent oxidoreductase [Modestobacter sp. SSW1-42]|uniref:molybdopterin-dependent oxidoreductase n=1 Tax=Modestobacter sp. SSW1-42 TaxID=596372 RepID=UPI0039871AB3
MTLPAGRRPEGAPVGRRVFLGLLGLGAVGVVGGAALQERLTPLVAELQMRDPTGLIASLPAGEGFRFYSVTGAVPEVTPDAYRLAVSGLVERSAEHTLAALQAMPQTELVRDFQCVTGWRVRAVPWVGVPLSHLLDLAGPTGGATAVRLTSSDGEYTESLTLEQARRPDVLVALRMLGSPVTHDHGGPVRLYAAPMYGYKSIKWLDRIELTAEVRPGYWEARGYDLDGWVGTTNGRDDDPTA